MLLSRTTKRRATKFVENKPPFNPHLLDTAQQRILNSCKTCWNMCLNQQP